ncbi:MAG: UDP-N-acetylmuramoyl-L-alanyl-D-glutamate--2,6-diaminopimelate ligase [Gemmatimonadales bacterium]|nr:UDP-N-acetylmuramoyl-L-alanyl-D-glutamate--2,6-diaminopimelate ligase [Gemmatimonadales bacterium]NIN50005.1 UDP-N-acetylmuramoyl-L-alanyl-D-glutamate--2,6-diaminopimelate ligase [Gemmatimonadales bacterium]NIP07469.1 UDP-N-acetylmuramoyl-L-alanyl-D-glutamate--2,6-diaminopimelate ligase [Gemmatimonadales bacterium]NIR03108.1 UDP-N-acetylmuramoyl-L-alanyl-D-glutamate--2,6-diaminopimelate ligase [Gemmatimonadales bacterium]NIS66820.1 UDP-N-acetylmuramoyl-L-alanyl-D-glutamate--2,6-diaminopimela
MTVLESVLSTLREAGQLVSAPEQLPDIAGVTEDSRRVVPGCLFCAVKGTALDGHEYVADAQARGAAAALVTRPVGVPIPQIVVRDSRSAASLAAREWYGRPGDGLEIIGVTGTNGKTTTVALLRHVLSTSRSVGSVGTLGAFDAAGQALEGYGTLTTPGAVELQAVLAELKAGGVGTVVMEASSHALDQRRLETLSLRAAVYTNLTHDHLDYHTDFEAYRAAKLALARYVPSGGFEVVNGDDEAWRALPQREGVRRVLYGRGSGVEVGGSDVKLGNRCLSFTMRLEDAAHRITLPLLGDFNVSNALAAAAAAWTLGEEPQAIAAALAATPQIAGRMEQLVAADFVVLRDYAHTPDALERAVVALRPITTGRLIVLFGAGGDRDRRKRPVMGGVVARGADLAIVTSDNPRTEDPDRIVDDIEAGMEGKAHLRITDRRDAIHQAIALARPGDCILLAGKGHETYQVIGTERRPFDEREIVRAALEQRASA